MATSLVNKFKIKAGFNLLVINPPDGYREELGELPKDVVLGEGKNAGNNDFVLLFAQFSTDLTTYLPQALEGSNKSGVLWIAYPKKSSKIETDLTRDEGWLPTQKQGLRPVSMISFNQVWSAVRFRYAEHSSAESIVDAQFSGKKEALRPIYGRLLSEALALGVDVKVGARKSYIAIARKNQFLVIKPSTITRIDVGFKLPGKTTTKRLMDAGNFGSGSITHKVGVTSIDEVDAELTAWMKEAYGGTG